jgi:thiosulfate reductase cytochrome b subunit
MSEPIKDAVEIDRRHWVYRHRLPVRITHWINVVCLIILLMSGLQIFNAHPALYWGNHSDFGSGFIEMKAADDDESKGITRIAGHTFDTTGFLGVSRGADGQAEERGFPRWLTIPSGPGLAVARRWHLFFAWLLVLNGLVYVVYVVYGALSRHFTRDLAPTKCDWRARARIHARPRFRRCSRPTASTDPQDEDYLALAKDNFASWKLGVEGLVDKPAQFHSRLARDAGAHADHAPRLRRGLELHRQVDRRSGERSAQPRRRQAAGEIRRLLRRRRHGC